MVYLFLNDLPKLASSLKYLNFIALDQKRSISVKEEFTQQCDKFLFVDCGTQYIEQQFSKPPPTKPHT
jgi:hypothetical protein